LQQSSLSSSPFHTSSILQGKVEILSFNNKDNGSTFEVNSGILAKVLPVGSTVQTGDVVAMIDIQTSEKETEQIAVHAPQTGRITQIYCNLKDKISVGDSLLEIDDSTQEDMKQLQEEIQKSKGLDLSDEYMQSILQIDDAWRLQFIAQNIPPRLQIKALTIYERILELQQDDPAECAKTHTQLAVTLYNLGDLNMSLQQLQKALQLRKETMGDDNPQVAATHIHLGALYRQIGEMEKSLPHMLDALEIQKKALGDDHPVIASSYNNVGALYYQMMDFTKAIEQYDKALAIHLKNVHHGENHADTSGTYHNLGIAWKHFGDFDKAHDYLQKALQVRQETAKLAATTSSTTSSSTPDVAASHTALGQLFAEVGQFDEAMKQYDAALKIQKEVFGPNAAVTAIGYNNIGAVYYQQGNYADALQNYQTGLDILCKADPSHADTASSWNNVGLTYFKMDQVDKALDHHQHALEILKKIYGGDHPNLATTIGSIGTIYKAQERWEESLKEFQIAHGLLEKAIGTLYHPDIASSYNNMGLVLSHIPGREQDALGMYRSACESFEKSVGSEHPHVGSCRFNMGLMLQSQGLTAEAKKEFVAAKGVWEVSLGPTHGHTAMAQKSTEECS
jgi:tetratricopeptide (TPR) repeat protein